MKKRKRPFLLLELLIGIGLLTLFALPLIVNPFFLLQTEIAALERMELERMAEVQFANLKEKIHKQEIPWSHLTQKEEGEPIKGEIFIDIPGLSHHRFQTATYIWSKKQRKGKEQKDEFHLIAVKITYAPKPRGKHPKKPISFNYRLALKGSQE